MRVLCPLTSAVHKHIPALQQNMRADTQQDHEIFMGWKQIFTFLCEVRSDSSLSSMNVLFLCLPSFCYVVSAAVALKFDLYIDLSV